MVGEFAIMDARRHGKLVLQNILNLDLLQPINESDDIY